MPPSETAVSEVPESNWLSVAEAATSVGVPLRTLHRWVKAGAIRCRADGRKRLVPLAEVQHHAAERHATGSATLPASAGTVPARAPVASHVAHASDGELAARVFRLLGEGQAPAAIVQQECLPPAVVLALTDQWNRLRASGKPGDVPLPEQLRALRRDLEALREQYVEQLEVMLPVTLNDVVDRVARARSEAQTGDRNLLHRLEAVERQVGALSQQLSYLWRGP